MHSTDTATPPKPQQFSFAGPCRVNDSVRGPGLPPMLTCAALCAALYAAGCGRTSLEPPFGTPVTDASGAVEHPADRPIDRPADRAVDRAVDRMGTTTDAPFDR